jgi:DNA-binding HxlR family transcriptional regulator
LNVLRGQNRLVLGGSLHWIFQLETDGLIHRKVYPEVPPRVEYYVSDFGMTLIPHLENLMQWGQENFSVIMKNRKNNV